MILLRSKKKSMAITKKLQKKDFNNVKEGKKIVELFLRDKEVENLKLGDKIEFLKFPDFRERQTVTVKGIFIYNSFKEIIKDLPASHFGYPEKEKEEILKDIYKTHDRSREEESEVLGVRFEVQN